MVHFKKESDWEDYQKYEQYRWEFMRRSSQYRQAYKEAVKLRKRAEKRNPGCTGNILASDKETTPYYFTKEGEEEMKLAKVFGMRAWLYDPDVGWSEMTVRNRRIFAWRFKSKAVQMWEPHPANGTVSIRIDFNIVNSSDVLKKKIAELIDQYVRRHPEYKKRNYLRLYDRFLNVGDLKEENKAITWREIAAIVFPKETGFGADSAEKKVQQAFKRYQELINGGYKNITYP